MSRTRNLKIFNETEITAITDNQKIIIATLQDDIQRLIRKINKPYSITLSAILTPLIFEYIFLNHYSPFFYFYEKLASTLNAKHVESYYESSEKYNFEFRNQIKIWKHFYTQFKQNLFSPKVTKEMLIQHGGQAAVNTLHTLYAGCWVLYDAITKGHYPPIHAEGFLQEAASLSAQDLFHEINHCELHLEKRMAAPNILETEIVRVSKNLSIKEANAWLLLIKLPFVLALQYLLLDKLFLYQFPHGIGMPSIPVLDKNCWISKEIAQKYIVKLQDHKIRLNQSARIYIYCARILFFIFITLALVIFSSNNPSSFQVYLGLGLLAVAMTDFVQHLNEMYDYYSLKFNNYNQNWLFQSVTKQYQKLQHFCLNLPLIVDLQARSTLSQSYFVFNLKDHKGIPKKTIGKLLRKYFKEQGIEILLYDESTLTIPYNFPKKSLANLKIRFEKSLEQMLGIKRIHRDIRQFLEYMNSEVADELLYIPFYDAQELPTAKFEFISPITHVKELNILLSALEENNQVHVYESNTTLEVSVTGHQPSIQDIFIKQKNFHACPLSQAEMDEYRRERELGLNLSEKRPLKLTTRYINHPTIAPKQILPAKIIVWQSYTHDSRNPKSLAHPIFMGKTHTQAAANQARYYTFFKLRQEIFPTEATYTQAKNMVEQPVLKRRGCGQGLVFANSLAENQDGKMVQTFMKARLKGKTDGKGDIRIRATIENSPTGEQLYIFECIKLHAH